MYSAAHSCFDLHIFLLDLEKHSHNPKTKTIYAEEVCEWSLIYTKKCFIFINSIFVWLISHLELQLKKTSWFAVNYARLFETLFYYKRFFLKTWYLISHAALKK